MESITSGKIADKVLVRDSTGVITEMYGNPESSPAFGGLRWDRPAKIWGSLLERNSQKSEPVRRWRSGSDFVISVYKKDYKIGATLKRGS